MDPSFTESAAQDRLVALAKDTLGTLPVGTELTRDNPTLGRTPRFRTSRTLPCDDNDQTGAGPVNLQFERWVQGTLPEQANGHLDAALALWKGRGWSVRDDGKPSLRQVRAFTDDGYALTLYSNDIGYLTLAGSSPCFPRANTGAGTPLPATILRGDR